ncbi:hypothetical protein HYV82_05950 [Candidatus Woesearchaeota archaeon]|nr:hypothetical protein [Candidatus Woesearchaeota archaeon]
MMRKTYYFLFAAVFALVALSAAAGAAISIDSVSKRQLNIGDKLTVSYNLSSGSDVEAIFRLGLKCSGFELDYYTIPVSLKAGGNKSVVAPPLTVNSQMLGSCAIKALLQSTDKVSSEELQSDQFDVTNSIGVKLETDGRTFFPGEKLELRGSLEESFNTLNTVTVTMERQAVTLGVSEKSFNLTLELPKTIKSGTHKLAVIVNDSYGNSGESSLVITLAQVPTGIALNADRERANPVEEIKLYAVLLDQANDSMQGRISVRLLRDKDELFARELDSGELSAYKFDAYSVPGIYTLKASSLGIKAEKKLTINTVEDISINFDGKRIIDVKNTGNIDYEKYADIRLSLDDGSERVLVKKLKLKPGELASFDLYKEVPAGTYTVSFISGNEQKEYPKVATEDERSFMKKLGDLLGGVTGLVVGTNASEGVLFRKPFLVTATVLAIVVLLIVIYRGEKKRRAESSQNRIDSMETEKARILSSGKEEVTEHKSSTLSRDDPDNRKFVEEMLKGKQFK